MKVNVTLEIDTDCQSDRETVETLIEKLTEIHTLLEEKPQNGKSRR